MNANNQLPFPLEFNSDTKPVPGQIAMVSVLEKGD